jgi:hypothetical protein
VHAPALLPILRSLTTPEIGDQGFPHYCPSCCTAAANTTKSRVHLVLLGHPATVAGHHRNCAGIFPFSSESDIGRHND